MKIPVLNNPQHSDNLANIQLLELQGWEGADACLATSLFEYRMAWRNIPKTDDCADDFLFLYPIGEAFDRCGMSSKVDLLTEFDWMDWKGFFSFLGTKAEEWSKCSFPHKIYDLVNYAGAEEIFGSSYWEGFQVSEYESFHPETGQYCHPCGYLTSYFRQNEGAWVVTEWADDFSQEEITRIVKFVQTQND